MQAMFFLDRAAGAVRSGLTGPADIPDPPRADRPRGLRARARLGARTVSGTVRGAGRVARLGWQASPWLTVGLGVSTVLMGLMPAVTTSLGRLLINTVVAAVEARVRHVPATTVLTVPLPGWTPSSPRMAVLTALIVLAVAQLLVYGLTTLSGAVRNITQQLLQERVAQTVELRIMDHARRLDLAFFEGSSSYDLLHQARREAANRSLTMISGSATLIQTTVTFAGMITLLVGLYPWLALLALIAPLPAFVADARYGMKGFLVSLLAAPIRRRMEYLATLVTTDTHAKEVRLFDLGGFFVRRFRLLGRTFYRRLRRVVARRYLVGAAWTSISTLTGTLTYVYVALQAIGGRLTLGDLTLYTSASSTLQTSLQSLFQGFSSMYENNLYLDNLYELLAVPPGMPAPERPRPLSRPVRGEVTFEHVGFAYPGGGPAVLRDVSFTIPAGQTVAVVGRNGAGKSTLLKLLCRLYDPTEGRILLDGVDIRELDPAELRAEIGAMFQDYVTYQATAAENVGLGDVTRIEDRGAVERAIGRAGADELVGALPDGPDTPLGRWFDRGVQLSGGEWQKVALARAFMRETPLLVLDEPTSALDAVAERQLFDRLAELTAGRTTLYISHRFSTVRRAQRILVIEDGRLTEMGTHAELMDRDGTYAALFTLQAAAYISPEGSYT